MLIEAFLLELYLQGSKDKLYTLGQHLDVGLYTA